MQTTEKVLAIFAEYLSADKEEELVLTSRGYIRIIWADKHPEYETCFCPTPEALFDTLLSDYQTYEEIKLTKGRRELTAADAQKVDALLQPYLKKREMEELL